MKYYESAPLDTETFNEQELLMLKMLIGEKIVVAEVGIDLLTTSVGALASQIES